MGVSDSPTQAEFTAIDLKLSRAKGILTIAWRDGHTSVLQASALRKACPCAGCNETRRKETKQLFNILSKDPGQGPPQLTGASLVGNYAIQLVWADGHNTGIYNFKLLRSMDEQAK